MRINKFNPNYIMINFSDITKIIFNHSKNYEKEFISELKDIEKAIYKDDKDNIELFTRQMKEIAIKKDSPLGQTILSNSLINLRKRITEKMMKEAIVVATAEGNYEYAKKISDILITNKVIKCKYDIEDYEIFKMIYTEELADFIVENGNLENYINILHGDHPYEEDRYVYFYEDKKLNKICLPILKEEVNKKKK